MQNIQVIKISLHQAERFFLFCRNTVGIGCNEKNSDINRVSVLLL